jgi:hypothetical protein
MAPKHTATRVMSGSALCGTLGEFLADRSERTLEWPLAEARRRDGPAQAGGRPVMSWRRVCS